MSSPQMTSLLHRYGVTTEKALLTAIARDEAENTGQSYRSVRRIAPIILDQALEAEYQRIAGGAYEPIEVKDAELELARRPASSPARQGRTL